MIQRTFRLSAIGASTASLLFSLATAANACPGTVTGNTYQVSNAQTTTCALAAAENLQVTSTGSVTTSGPAVTVGAVIAGDITNAGTLSADLADNDSGVVIVGPFHTPSGAPAAGAGTITNSGTINPVTTGQGAGIRIQDAAVAVIDNQGTITGFDAGVYATANEAALSIGYFSNSGTIQGLNTGVGIGGAAMGSLSNSGTIDGGSSGLRFSGSDLTGRVSNSGTLSSEVGSGLSFSDTRVADGVHNTGLITGAHGIEIDSAAEISGGIYNEAAGRIIATRGNGIHLVDEGVVRGGLHNAGTISGTQNGVYIEYETLVQGGITNTGTITAYGTFRNGGSAIMVEEDAVVEGDVINSGSLLGYGPEGRGFSIVPYGTVTGNVINTATGIMQGTQAGILLGNHSTLTGDIINSGHIEGSGAMEGDGIRIESSGKLTGKITNSGTITGSVNAINILNTDFNQIDNAGTLLGQVVLGNSILSLNGNSARVVGGTSGSLESTVNVNGLFASEGGFSVGQFNIAPGGTFRMNHDVSVSPFSASAFHNAGTLAIDAGSTRTITGSYHQASGAIYQLGLASPASYGKLVVSGDASLDSGAIVHVDVAGSVSLTAGAVVPDVIKADGTLTAGVPVVTDTSYLFDLTPSTARDAKALDLLITAAPTTIVDALPPQDHQVSQGAAAMLDAAIAAGAAAAAAVPQNPEMAAINYAGLQDVVTALGKLGSAGQVSSAVRQTLPLPAGSLAQATNATLRHVQRIVQARVQDNTGLKACSDASDRHLWVKPFAGDASQDSRDGADGFKARSSGLAAGVDGAIGKDHCTGVAVSYARGKVDIHSGVASQRADVDSYELIGYGAHQIDSVTDLFYQADIGRHGHQGARSISFMGTFARSDFSSNSVHAGIGIQRLLPLDAKTRVTPSLRLDYSRIRSDAYTESGAGGLNLKVGEATWQEMLLAADARLTHDLSPTVRFVGNATLAHDFKASQDQTTSAYSGGGASFATPGLNRSPWLYRLGAGLTLTQRANMDITVAYDLEARPSGYLSQGLSAKWRVLF